MTNLFNQYKLNPALSPESVLGKIVQKKILALDEQLKNLDTTDLNVSTRSLFNALSTEKSGFICEYKQASPTLGNIREGDSVETIVSEYATFAVGISVLTEYEHFKGELDFIPRAKKVCSQPVLCKDFVVTPEQVQQARQYDADVVLLMLSVLSDEQYRACAKVANELSLDILTEVHDEEELERALNLDAKIIGINNRDLRDLSIDLAATEKLVALIPDAKRKNIRLVSESGIKTHQDVQRLAHLVDGFLIGSSLMSEPRIDLKLREIIFGQVKICGLTSSVDADLAYMQGATLGGMILAEGSKRTISIKRATSISKRTRLPLVAVFRNQSVEFVLAAAEQIKLHAVQLHGDEDAAYITTLKEKLDTSIQIWKTLHVTDTLPPQPAVKVDALLLENGNSKLAGGSGESFNWSLLEKIAETYTDYSINEIILAGGLNPDNIDAAKQTDLQRFDLASGVEFTPGKKDIRKTKQLFKNIRL